MRMQNIYKQRPNNYQEDATATLQDQNFHSPLANNNLTTVSLIEKSIQNIKKKNQEGQLRLKLPSHINPQYSPKSQISGIEGAAFKFASQSLSRQNSKKTLKYLQQQALTLPQRNRVSNLNHFQPTETHLSVLGKTKLSPQQRNAETQIIKSKLVKLNSLPYRVMRRINNEEIKQELQKNMELHALRNQSVNEQQYSSLLESSQITEVQNQVDQFQKIKDQFWQQSNSKNYSTISQQQQYPNQIYGGPSLQSTTIQQDSLQQPSYMMNIQSAHAGASQSLYNKINFGKLGGQKFTLNMPEGFEDRRRFGQRKAESVNTSRSHTNSPNRAPKLSKLVYKLPSPAAGSQLQGGSYRFQPAGLNYNSSIASNYQTTQYDQNKLPELFNQTQTLPVQTPQSQFGGGIFITGASAFDPTQKQVANEISLMDRANDKFSLKINTQFNQIDNPMKDFGLTPLKKNTNNNLIISMGTQYDTKPLRTTSMIENFGDIEKRLLSEIADCTVCQEKFRKFIKQQSNTQSQMSIDYQLISVESTHSIHQQRATFKDKDHHTSTQLVTKMASVLEKKIVDAKSQTLQSKFDSMRKNINQDSKVSSLPRISDKRGSKADLLSELNKVESHHSLGSFQKKRNSVDNLHPANTDYYGLIEHYKHHLHKLFHQHEGKEAEEDDSNQLIMDLVQDDQQLSSFLTKQQEKVQLRESIKEQFEQDSNVDQDEFQRMILFPSTSALAKKAKEKKKRPSEEADANPIMKSSMMSGLGLKIKEKLMKGSENANMTRFYDFLLSIRERENFLSQNLRDIIKPKYQEQTQEWMIEYLKECEKQHTVPLALAATQIKNSHYFLNDYQLNEGIVKALCQSINLSEEKLIKLTLSQNQISDSQFALLLASLNQRQVNSLKSIIYCNLNEFGPKSFEVLKAKYLSKYIPNQMEELRIVNCRISAGVINNILTGLKEICFLKRLSLPRCRLSDQSLDILAYLLNKNQAPHLIELDISWNGISVNSLTKIFKSLQTNTNLQTFNLSWNEVKESVDITPFCQFIGQNNSLVHLDLSKMFNSAKQLKRILKAIKKSLSLQAVHFANTPILVNDLRLNTYMFKKLRAKQANDKKFKKPNIYQLFKNDWRSQMKTQFLMNEGEKELQEYSCYNLSQDQLAADPSTIQENLILQRVLGHPEIADSSQWLIKSGKGDYRDCYVCGRWQYTIFMRVKEKSNNDQSSLSLANPLSAIMGGTQNSSHSIMMKKTTMMQDQLITDSTLQVKIKGSYESFRNFKTQKMINVLKFTQILDPKYISAEDKFEESLKSLDHSTVSMITKNQILREQKFYEVRKEVENHYKEHWKTILSKQIKYRHIQFVPESLTFENTDETLYVFADFVKPTNQLEQVNVQDQPPHLFFPQVRRDELSLISIKAKEQKFEDRNVNVFADWKVDTEQTFDEIIEIDVKYWKVQKLIKDKKDYDNVVRVIRKYLRDIKDIYISLICQSNYPHLGWLDFARFIQQCCILDENTNMAHIDLMFIAANVEMIDLQENPDKSLCRYEFLELLVRIAAHKFKNAELSDTYSDSVERLLQSYVLRYYQPLSWQQFREEEIWVREVNLVLDANLDSLQKLYKKYIQPKQSWLSVQDAVAMMIKDSPSLDFAHIEVIQAYGMSQMTVRNEMEKGVNPYTKLVFVEFLEFICRCANIKYRQSADLLYRKVERFLDQILPLVNSVRKDFVRKAEVIQPESDESILSEQLFENINDLQSQSEDQFEL